MKGDFRKLFGFFKTSKNPEDHRRQRSASIACPRDAIRQGTNLSLHNGDGAFGKQTYFPNNTVPRRRNSQPAIRDRSLCVSVAGSGLRRNFEPAVKNPSSTVFERRIRVVKVHLDNSVVMEDFGIEDIREVWSSLKNRGIFNDTSVEDGYLTTTLCSTELWSSMDETNSIRSRLLGSRDGWCRQVPLHETRKHRTLAASLTTCFF